ncbi:MAG TPA: pantoate--beta-alanine ligase [Flavobacteriales bacterium]|jgi:pantoate--beta-alanine ligase|nr:pantoate--beta-alanine ligase [Flavobacteriales bacterium]
MMQILRKASDIQQFTKESRAIGNSLSLVPTMGALHEGHLSLVKMALKHSDVCLATIFINPKQFNRIDDLKAYPRNEERDIHLLQEIGCSAVFIPEYEDIYSDDSQQVNINLIGLDQTMEGASRPGHFQGVLEIIHRFFVFVKPNIAVFGEKDFQQLRIIEQYSKSLIPKVNILRAPIFREKNGLAMSSRNERLSSLERSEAGFVYAQLKRAVSLIHEIGFEETLVKIKGSFKKHPHIELEYLILADEHSLQEHSRISSDKSMRLFIACFIRDIRLIDNVALSR